MWTGNEPLDIEQLNGFGSVLAAARAIVEDAQRNPTWPKKRISAELLYRLRDALNDFGGMEKIIGNQDRRYVGRQVTVRDGASEWMQDHGHWLDNMGDSIDGQQGVIVGDYVHLGGSDSHFGIDFGDGNMIGVHPDFIRFADHGG